MHKRFFFIGNIHHKHHYNRFNLIATQKIEHKFARNTYDWDWLLMLSATITNQ